MKNAKKQTDKLIQEIIKKPIRNSELQKETGLNSEEIKRILKPFIEKNMILKSRVKINKYAVMPKIKKNDKDRKNFPYKDKKPILRYFANRDFERYAKQQLEIKKADAQLDITFERLYLKYITKLLQNKNTPKTLKLPEK